MIWDKHGEKSIDLWPSELKPSILLFYFQMKIGTHGTKLASIFSCLYGLYSLNFKFYYRSLYAGIYANKLLFGNSIQKVTREAWDIIYSRLGDFTPQQFALLILSQVFYFVLLLGSTSCCSEKYFLFCKQENFLKRALEEDLAKWVLVQILRLINSVSL